MNLARPRVPAATAEAATAYSALLHETRGLRGDQQQLRDKWFASLAADRKEELLFEFEILLKGIACFANPRNERSTSLSTPNIREEAGVTSRCKRGTPACWDGSGWPCRARRPRGSMYRMRHWKTPAIIWIAFSTKAAHCTPTSQVTDRPPR